MSSPAPRNSPTDTVRLLISCRPVWVPSVVGLLAIYFDWHADLQRMVWWAPGLVMLFGAILLHGKLSARFRAVETLTGWVVILAGFGIAALFAYAVIMAVVEPHDCVHNRFISDC